jgi:hypothetical protein
VNVFSYQRYLIGIRCKISHKPIVLCGEDAKLQGKICHQIADEAQGTSSLKK